MARFKVVRTIYTMVFEDDLEGMAVKVRSMSTGDLLDLTRASAVLAGKVVDGFDAKSLDPADLDSMTLLFERFATALVSWNLDEEDGTPIPATLAGVRSLDQPLTMRLIMEWMRAAGGVPAPLVGGSTSGGTFPEASIPMEPLLTSP